MITQRLFGAMALLLVTSLISCGSGSGEEPTTPAEELDPVTEYFENEKRPTASVPDCFNGAYYRKIVTESDRWVGIEGQVVLPELHLDPDRMHETQVNKHKDNPSIYMGGNASGQETDIGLAWEQIVANGPRVAFRPFLRRTAFAATGQEANFMNGTNNSNFYWYPGDVVTMRIEIVQNGVLRFTVEGEGKRYEVDYPCDGYTLNSNVEFKRVNAIDQMGNEGKPVQASTTKITGSKWNYTKLLRYDSDGSLLEVNMHSGRYYDMRCPDTKYFEITASDAQAALGSETIDIIAGE